MEKITSFNEQRKSHMERHPELYDSYTIPKAVYVKDPTRTVEMEHVFLGQSTYSADEDKKEESTLIQNKESFLENPMQILNPSHIVEGISKVFENISKKSSK
jgi:hypothetical protein